MKELVRLENVYRCPTDSLGHWKAKHHTSYVAIAGEETPWPDSGKINFQDISDGLSNVVLVVESHATGITWSEPRDLNEADINYRVNDDSQPGLSSLHGPFVRYFDGTRRVGHRDRCNVLMADGSSRSISNDIDPEVLKALVNRRDGKAVEIP